MRWNPLVDYQLRTRSGYIFLITVLFVGTIALSSLLSLLLLGWAEEQNGATYVQSVQARNAARTCLDYGLRELRASPTYGGNDSLTLADGSTCSILPVLGSGPGARSLCTEGKSGQAYQRMMMTLSQVYPSVKIKSFEQTESGSGCVLP